MTMSNQSHSNESNTAGNDSSQLVGGSGEGSVAADSRLIQSIMNSLRGKTGSDSGNSNEENNSDMNGGNNSDNSALVSIGNSLGFNFDGEEGMSSNSKEGQTDSNDDSDGVGGRSDSKVPASTSAATKRKVISSMSSMTSTASNQEGACAVRIQNEAAANAAVANLQSIVSSYTLNSFLNNNSNKDSNSQQQEASVKIEVEDNNCPTMMQEEELASRKRRSLAFTTASDRSVDNDSGGYNTDDDDGDFDDQNQQQQQQQHPMYKNTANSTRLDSVASTTGNNPKSRSSKKKRANDSKREERNQREKERSLRISKQIGELRNLLSSGGVVVPKGTKSSVLTEAANYIRMLQQHHYRSEIDRHQLVQQMQLIGGGAHGPQAAAAIRHVAAQNGVWSLGNFGGVPPKSAMAFYDPSIANAPTGGVDQTPKKQTKQPQEPTNPFDQNKIDDPSEYRFVFNSCGAGMAIASMGGAFIDCNQLFCQLSNYTKQEVCSLTIFNMTARQDLQRAFDQISQLISPPMDESGIASRERPKPIVFQGALKNRDDLGLSVSLVKGDDGIAKCFCVTLVKNRESPFDTSKPIPVSFDSILRTAVRSKDGSGITSTPAFTSG